MNEDFNTRFAAEQMNQKIFALTAPYSNPYQGIRTRILFVCSAGLLRSPTGAHVGTLRGYNTRSAGSSAYALIPLSVNLISWAEHIVFVNPDNYNEALEVFELVGYNDDIERKSIVLDIPDRYEAFSPQLIQIWNDWFDKFEAKKAH